MEKFNILIYFAFCLTLFLSGCAKEQEPEEGDPDGTPIDLSGMFTRNDGVNGANLYLKAFYTGSPYPYFGELLFSVQGGLTSQEKELIFSGTNPYYPLSSTTISLFAFSGKLRDGQSMVLKAGSGDSYDAVLSNYGLTGGSLSGEGQGTTGSASLPAEVLYFRHVMTKVTVTVIVDGQENPPVDPVPNSIQFRMNDVASQGLYNIRSAAPVEGDSNPDVAIKDGTALYTMQKGVNYLVPTGQNLAGQGFSYLKIDDYTATAADLAKFKISAAEGNTNDMLLLPGYAYELEIKVQKLGVTGVTVRLIDWNRTELNGDDVTTTDYPLTLSLGDYENSGEDEVTKVILHTSDRIYAGQTMSDGSGIGFVRLPADETVTSVELHTAKGLLLTADNVASQAYRFDNAAGSGTLTLDVSAGGMVTADGTPYTSENPYLVQTPLQLINIDKAPTLNYRQAVNLNMSELTLDQAGVAFGGIGQSTAFSGTFNGNGFLISNLKVSGPGLFVTNNGTLQNVRIYTGTIDAAGQSYAGALAGTNNGMIVACINEAQITGDVTTAGGICGLNGTDGEIVGCLNTGIIPSAVNAGGICGENRSTTEAAITSCLNTGMLNSQAALLGGICGNSVATDNQVVHTSFWLVGSAEHGVGNTEYAVGSNNLGLDDSSALDPTELRAVPDPEAVIPNDQLAISRLNNGWLQEYPASALLYEFVSNGGSDSESLVVTGISWPAPVKKSR